MRIFIRPLDVQFYRDGRPFDAGIESAGSSSLLPHPRTIYGALRACILARHSCWGGWPSDQAVKKVVGQSPFKFGSLAIKGPVLGRLRRDLETFYPIPKDLVKLKDQDEIIQLAPKESERALNKISNLKYQLFPTTAEHHVEEIEEKERYFIDHYNLYQYLSGRPPKRERNLKKSSDLLRQEHRIGIGLRRDPMTRTAQEGLLYSVNPVRFCKDVGLVVDVEGDDGLLPPSGLLRLGGESRGAVYSRVEDVRWDNIIEEVKRQVSKSGRFKLYLITPAIFSKGWYPDFLEEECGQLKGAPPGVDARIELVGACVGKPLFIGGFHIRRGYPKPIYKAVPPGSVYFMKISKWDVLSCKEKEKILFQLFERFFYKSLIDQDSPLWKEGFGVALVGGW